MIRQSKVAILAPVMLLCNYFFYFCLEKVTREQCYHGRKHHSGEKVNSVQKGGNITLAALLVTSLVCKLARIDAAVILIAFF